MDKESAKQCPRKQGIIVDVRRNKIIETPDSTELTDLCVKKATDMGYFIQSNKETAGFMDLVKLFRRYFDLRSDLALLVITVSGLRETF